MLCKMRAAEALKKHLSGRKVLVVEEQQMPDGSTEYTMTDLETMLSGARFLVETVAVEDPDQTPAAIMASSAKAPAKQVSKKEPEEPKAEKKAGKRWYVTAADKEDIERLYRAGKTMEEISDEIQVTLTPISRCVAELGLGAERYRGQAIPSSGSSQIAQAASFGGARKG